MRLNYPGGLVMSRLGELVAYTLNRLFPPLAMHRKLQIAKSRIEANQQWAYEEATRICPYFYPYWELRGKRVLDVGTGLGGKLPFYTEEGAAFLVGVDLDKTSVHIAREYLNRLGLSGAKNIVTVTVADAVALPFRSNSFDVVISINTFEHILEVEKALWECYRILRPGGLVFLHFPPYYSPWGPHLESWIHFP